MPGHGKCAVAKCTFSHSKIPGREGIFSSFRFPKNPEMRSIWVRRCGRADSFDPEKSRICGLHFTQSDLSPTYHLKKSMMPGDKLKPVLQSSAVPSMHLPMTTAVSRCKDLRHPSVMGADDHCSPAAQKPQFTIIIITRPSVTEDCSPSDQAMQFLKQEREPSSPKAERITEIYDASSADTILTKDDDDWDVKWRVDVPDRDPLELTPDTEVPSDGSNLAGDASFPKVEIKEDRSPSSDVTGDLTAPKDELSERQSPVSQGGEEILHCPHCSYSCLEHDLLDRHVQKRHGHIGRNGRHKCEWCQYSTDMLEHMTRHRRTHTGERPYRCSDCDRTFSYPNSLARHRLSHTEQRPFKCDICEKAFKQSSHLTRHKLVHSEDRAVQLKHCDTTFEIISHCNAHTQLHGGDEPLQCSGGCPERSNIIRPRRTHTVDRPHACSICTARFRRHDHLNKHMQTHTGKRPYGCSSCPARFLSRSNLAQHLRIHSRERP
ncbi:zinc finger protein 835-like isoform X3 [Amphibalanus amphitrite]|uniref:zinc finger protein 835-like isoform X3 n=1 Tax=Amphibalanus amphitrite TaxID=1232801 RepID=UPI001C9016A2|nr:zinc finger protein 835-like isoform X3 [Amphibalanus amphitrite]